MQSPASYTRFETGPVAPDRRNGADVAEGKRNEGAARSIEVEDVVQRGTGRGSRLDLTVVAAGGKVRVRLTAIPAKHVLSYGSIEKRAMEQGVVLPFFRSANEVWREALSVAMDRARLEPSLEGEEIAETIAAEIRALLERCDYGDRASDLAAGKAVRPAGLLLVSPSALVQAVRARLVDDVLPRATIAEAAAVHLGMRETRPRFADAGKRPRVWAFPSPSWSAIERDCDEVASEPPLTVGVGAAMRGSSGGPVHGPGTKRPIHLAGSKLQAGSSGPEENVARSRKESLDMEASS